MTWLVHVAVLCLQVAIVATLVVGVRRGDVTAAVNSLVALVATLAPAGLEHAFDVVLGPELPLWVALAGLLHAFGMLGLYESTTWWDHLTHTVSAGFVAALVYAVAVGVAGHPPGIAVGVTLVVTLLIGILWELLELVARAVSREIGVEPLLIPYGTRDAALDLVFDIVGAAIVVALDLRVFVPVADQLVQLTWSPLLAAGTVGLSGTFMLLVAGTAEVWFELSR